MIEIIFLAGAEADVQAADRCSALLGRYPRIGRPHRGVYRKLLVPEHPYGVFYVAEPSRVVVVAVLDLRQDPEAIERRLHS